MMIRHAITYLIIALIAMQSVVAVADAHQLHQSGTEHLTFDHEHDQPTVNYQAEQEIKTSATMGSTSLDCHHCCHCHGMAHFFLASGSDYMPEVDLDSTLSGYQFHYSSYQSSPDNPPPII